MTNFLLKEVEGRIMSSLRALPMRVFTNVHTVWVVFQIVDIRDLCFRFEPKTTSVTPSSKRRFVTNAKMIAKWGVF